MEKVGTIVYEKSPVEGSRRNSEGSFLDLKDGRIIHVYSHLITGHDYASSSIDAIWSHDGGRSWSDPKTLVTMEDDGLGIVENDPQNIMSVSMLRMANGDVGLFYMIRRTSIDMRLVLRRSSDEGETWSAPVICTDSIGSHCIANDRVIRLSTGRILAPDSYFRMRHVGGDFKDPNVYSKIMDGYGDLFFHVSDDDGLTWHESPGRVKLNVPITSNGLQEPVCVELANGVIWCLARTDLGRQYQAFSFDQGDSWTDAQPSVFTSPISPMIIRRGPRAGWLTAVWNPVPITYSENYAANKWTQLYQKRSPLVIAVSRDDGRVWDDFKVVDGNEPDLPGQFSYPSLHFTGDAFLVAYMSQIRGGHPILIKRITNEEMDI